MDINKVRQQFPAVDRLVYFDLANKCPMPKYNVEVANNYLQKQCLFGGDKNEWYDLVNETRANFAKLINASEHEICFTKNTSEGLNIAANCLPLKKGDTVLLNKHEHPNNVYCWLNLEKRGIKIRYIPADSGQVMLDDLKKMVDGTTKVVAISSVTFAPGNRNDIEAIAGFCREKGIYTVIDAVQSFGTLKVDVQRWDADIVCTSGHKALLGPHGVGMMYINRRILGQIDPLYVARAGMDMSKTIEDSEVTFNLSLKDAASKFEIGNYNYLGLSMTNESLKFLLDLGMDNVEGHIMAVNKAIIEGLTDLGIEVVSPVSGPMRSAVVCFRMDNVDVVYESLKSKGILTTKRRGMIRLSIGPYTSFGDVEKLVSQLSKIKESAVCA